MHALVEAVAVSTSAAVWSAASLLHCAVVHPHCMRIKALDSTWAGLVPASLALCTLVLADEVSWARWHLLF